MKVVSYPLNLDTPKNQLEIVEVVLKLTSFRDAVESLEYKAKKEVDSLKKGLRKSTFSLERKSLKENLSLFLPKTLEMNKQEAMKKYQKLISPFLFARKNLSLWSNLKRPRLPYPKLLREKSRYWKE